MEHRTPSSQVVRDAFEWREQPPESRLMLFTSLTKPQVRSCGELGRYLRAQAAELNGPPPRVVRPWRQVRHRPDDRGGRQDDDAVDCDQPKKRRGRPRWTSLFAIRQRMPGRLA